MKFLNIVLLLAVCCSIVYIGTRPVEGETFDRGRTAVVNPNPMKVNPHQNHAPGEAAFLAKGN